jgi:hypothetical protein
MYPFSTQSGCASRRRSARESQPIRVSLIAVEKSLKPQPERASRRRLCLIAIEECLVSSSQNLDAIVLLAYQ